MLSFTFYHCIAGATYAIHVMHCMHRDFGDRKVVCLFVRLSVPPSVKRVNCDKTKPPSEKSSIVTNRKSTTSFPMHLRRTAYVSPKSQRGSKTESDRFCLKVDLSRSMLLVFWHLQRFAFCLEKCRHQTSLVFSL